jgi:hypothetical protein
MIGSRWIDSDNSAQAEARGQFDAATPPWPPFQSSIKGESYGQRHLNGRVVAVTLSISLSYSHYLKMVDPVR